MIEMLLHDAEIGQRQSFTRSEMLEVLGEYGVYRERALRAEWRVHQLEDAQAELLAAVCQ